MTPSREPGPGRSPFWRVLQLVAGVALFLYALRQVTPMPLERTAFVLVAALLGAGAMAVADSAVGLLAAVYESLRKGPKA